MQASRILVARAAVAGTLLLASHTSASGTQANRRSATDEIEALLSVCVDNAGKPYEVKVVRSSGDKSMDLAAARVAKKWRFEMVKPDGTKRAACEDVPITLKFGG